MWFQLDYARLRIGCCHGGLRVRKSVVQNQVASWQHERCTVRLPGRPLCQPCFDSACSANPLLCPSALPTCSAAVSSASPSPFAPKSACAS